jgi:hypothetical protein
MTTLDQTIEHLEFSPTGPIEPMELDHIDTAVVNRISEVVSRIATPRLREWAARPVEERVMIGEFESPRRFLMALAKKGVTKNQLPAIYVTREPGLVFADPATSAGVDKDAMYSTWDDDDNLVALIDCSVMTFTYTVNFVGWSDRDIEPLAALYCMWLRRRTGDKSIEVRTVLADTQLMTAGKFTDGPLATATNGSVAYEEGKLRSLSVTAALDFDYLQARYAEARTVKTEFALEVSGVV